MTLNARLVRIEQLLAEHEQQLGGGRIPRIENKLDALLAAVAEQEPQINVEQTAIDLDGNLPSLREMPPHRSQPL